MDEEVENVKATWGAKPEAITEHLRATPNGLLEAAPSPRPLPARDPASAKLPSLGLDPSGTDRRQNESSPRSVKDALPLPRPQDGLCLPHHSPRKRGRKKEDEQVGGNNKQAAK